MKIPNKEDIEGTNLNIIKTIMTNLQPTLDLAVKSWKCLMTLKQNSRYSKTIGFWWKHSQALYYQSNPCNIKAYLEVKLLRTASSPLPREALLKPRHSQTQKWTCLSDRTWFPMSSPTPKKLRSNKWKR